MSESLDSFGEWLQRRRLALYLTRVELAQCVGCSVSHLRKLETDERRPSRQVAELLASCLHIDDEEMSAFLDAARGIRRVARLGPAASRSTALPPLPLPKDKSPSAGPLWNLPAPATPLVGREAELATLVELLGHPGCRLLTLVGPGGIGKTRLALEAACEWWPQTVDGVFFASLAAIASPEFLVPAIGNALGYSFSGPVDPRRQLVRYLGDKQVLLLLDNLEHLLDGIQLLTEMLEAAPGLKLLVTSRERLELHGEWVFEVQGLPVPQNHLVEGVEQYSSVALFVQCVQRARANFELSAQNLPYAVRICQLVEGMPLGIELAAAWIPVLGCREIAHEIEKSLDFLSASLRDVPERQRSLRATFDHSWKLLTAEERKSLSWLAVFQGGFRREAAESIAEVTLLLLSALASKSLIHRTATGRYDMHEVVHQFAQSYLAEDSQAEATIRDRHCDFYLSLLRDREAALKGPTQQQTVAELSDEMNNIRAAWERAIECAKFTALEDALRSLAILFDMRGRHQEGIEQIERVVRMLQAGAEVLQPQKVLGQALAQQGLLSLRMGQFTRAQLLFEQSLAYLRPLDDPALLLDPLIHGGVVMHLVGEVDRAQSSIDEGVACARAVGDRWFEAYGLLNQGHISGLLGQNEQGYRQMLFGLEQLRALGDVRYLSIGLNFTSSLAIKLGRHRKAEAYLLESLDLCTQVGDRWGIGTAYRYLGLVALVDGNVAEARSLLRKSLEMFEGFVTGWDVVQSLLYLGLATVTEGEAPAALEIYQDALRRAIEAHAFPLALDVLLAIAELQAQNGEATMALELSVCILNHAAGRCEAKDRAQRLAKEQEARLRPEQAQAARARAEKRSLTDTAAQVLVVPTT